MEQERRGPSLTQEVAAQQSGFTTPKEDGVGTTPASTEGLLDRRRLPSVSCSAGGSSSIIPADAACCSPSRHRGKR